MKRSVRDFWSIAFSVALVLSFLILGGWLLFAGVGWLFEKLGPVPLISGVAIICLAWALVAEIRVALEREKRAEAEGRVDLLEAEIRADVRRRAEAKGLWS